MYYMYYMGRENVLHIGLGSLNNVIVNSSLLPMYEVFRVHYI